MKYILVAISLLNGVWMALDGVYVILNGKYIGPDKPGPWASLVGLTGVDVFKLGPMFVLYGLAWIFFAWFAGMGIGAWRVFGFVLSILTLWYLPFGTVISIVVIAALLFSMKS